MVDIQILEDGKVVLSRNIQKGEIVEYQNKYLRSENKTDTIEILKDLNKDDVLNSGALQVGEVVAKKYENQADYLVIKNLKMTYFDKNLFNKS